MGGGGGKWKKQSVGPLITPRGRKWKCLVVFGHMRGQNIGEMENAKSWPLDHTQMGGGGGEKM